MKTCKVCGEPYRKGQIVHIMGERGLQAVRACQKCAGKGVTLVATNPVTFVLAQVSLLVTLRQLSSNWRVASS